MDSWNRNHFVFVITVSSFILGFEENTNHSLIPIFSKNSDAVLPECLISQTSPSEYSLLLCSAGWVAGLIFACPHIRITPDLRSI